MPNDALCHYEMVLLSLTLPLLAWATPGHFPSSLAFPASPSRPSQTARGSVSRPGQHGPSRQCGPRHHSRPMWREPSQPSDGPRACGRPRSAVDPACCQVRAMCRTIASPPLPASEGRQPCVSSSPPAGREDRCVLPLAFLPRFSDAAFHLPWPPPPPPPKRI